MTPDVDVETLRLLVALSEKGSLSAAAQELGVSQPAVSARIREFEARWRITVAVRGPRGSTLTNDGLAVVSWARSVLHEADTMRAGLAALSEERGAALDVAASLTIAEFVLPRWLGELSERRANVRPRLHVVNSEKVEELVRHGEADVGFIETAERPHDLMCQVVGSDRLAIVVPPTHPWSLRGTPVSADQLVREAWVLREPGSGTRSTFEGALRRELTVALEADSTAALVGAARAGVGPSVVSRRAVAAELETGRLVEVRTELNLLRPFTAIWRRERRQSEAMAVLLRIASRHPAASPTS